MKIVYTSKHALHTTDAVLIDGNFLYRAEVPERAERILQMVIASGLGVILPPQDHGLSPILAVHDPDYVAYLQTAHARYAVYLGYEAPVMPTRDDFDIIRMPECPTSFPALLDYYTWDYNEPILAGTWDAAYWSAQVALTAAELVRNGENVVYALCRPPGHHATADQFGGYCYINNAAVATRVLAEDGPVAILDVDYHHGNGTQSVFYEDSNVLYASLHADPALDYPYYWGFSDELGSGPGLGTNFNFPLPLGTEDAVYLAALDQALEEIRRFRPVTLVVSMGLDVLWGDTIGKFRITSEGWGETALRTAALALPTVIVQEGGYSLATLGQHAVTFLSAFK